jgi:hypothetical protein
LKDTLRFQRSAEYKIDQGIRGFAITFNKKGFLTNPEQEFIYNRTKYAEFMRKNAAALERIIAKIEKSELCFRNNTRAREASAAAKCLFKLNQPFSR